MYDVYEKLLKTKLIDTLDSKNLSLISTTYSKCEKGSMDLWSKINKRFVEL